MIYSSNLLRIIIHKYFSAIPILFYLSGSPQNLLAFRRFLGQNRRLKSEKGNSTDKVKHNFFFKLYLS